ncbi:hypothetical protein KY084_04430 [Stakelama sp. CBK3Z-3]|uniref:Glycerophosphoryl diester phosphodiesterase membrane domain-containing protein n=1 Tax=Stakelama flava TaxID=2860338 RepID=A0ABS6XL31_9SPHN|nr:hypothetical protein [Stakelama flava]MBW4330120.1 hypothetical protein [Stakelama flava]
MDMGAVIGAGFRVIRERPGAFAVWAAVYIVVTVAMGLLFMPDLQGLMTAQETGAAPEAVFARLGGMALFYPLLMLALLILNNAAFRAILRPADSRAAYLRLGMDELRVFALGLLFVIVFAVLGMIIAMVAGVGMAFGPGRGSGTPGPGSIALFGLLGLGFFALWIFLSVRFALAMPLTVLRRKIVIGDAWRLSRGHFWAMLGAFIVVFLIYMIAAVMVSLITGGGMGAMGGLFDPDRLRQLGEQQLARQANGITVFMILGWIASGITGTFWVALSACGLASAALQLAPDSEEALEEIWR